MYIPLINDSKNGALHIDEEDQAYVDMIEKIQAEKAFYFSYDIDLTKNMQRTLKEIHYGSGDPQNRQERD